MKRRRTQRPLTPEEKEFYDGFVEITPSKLREATRDQGPEAFPSLRGRAPEIGDKVLIKGAHPHVGKIGTFVSVDLVSVLGGRYPKVQFPDGSACYIMGPGEWEKIK